MAKFTWSYTALNTFLTCPAQYGAKYFYKSVVFQENEAARWGTRVHAAGEEFIKTGLIPDPEGFTPVADFCTFMKTAHAQSGGELLAELECAITDKWKQTSWWAADVCGRGKLDLVHIVGDSACIYDYKTGKVKDDPLQLKIFCIMLAIVRPDVQNFFAEFFWTQTGTKTGLQKMVTRKELLPWIIEVNGLIERMRGAWTTEHFPEKRNGLCTKWCDVTTCKHNGRGL